MAIGRYNAYLTDAPVRKDYISDAMQLAESNSFLYREERRKIADAKKAEEDAKQTKIATDLSYIKNPDTTRFSTHNALAIDGADKLFKGSSEMARKYQKGEVSKVDYEIYLQNAKNQLDLMNQANQRINKQGLEYAELLKTGKIASGFEKNALDFGGAYDKVNMQWEQQPDGTLQLIAYDEDGRIIEKGNLSTFGQNSFTPVLNYDFDKDKQEFIKAYPKVLTETLGATTKTGIKGITPQIKEAIDLKVESIVKNPNALAIKAYEVTGQPNPKVEDPKIIEQVRENLTKEYEALYSPEKNVDEAMQRKNYELNVQKEKNDEAQRKKENARKKAALKSKSKDPSMENNVTGGGTVIRNENDTDKAGNTIPKEVKEGDKAYAVNGLQLSYNKGKTTKAINNVYINPKTNKMVFTGVDIDQNGVETIFKTTNTDEQARFVNRVIKEYDEDGSPIYYKTVDEFARDLKNKPAQGSQSGGAYDDL
jgi:hypothetical protein